MMGTLGEYLKTARQDKGMSLSDMAERTRISRHFLQALEEGDFSSIPGDVFVSGFLRSYAKELGLSEKEAMARYREETGEDTATSKETAPEMPEKVEGPSSSGPVSAKLVYYALAVIVVVLVIAFLTREDEMPVPVPVEAPPAASSDSEQHQLPGEGDIPPVDEVIPAETPQPGLEETSPVGETSPGEQEEAIQKSALNLKITALTESWYLLTVDGSPGSQGILAEGQTVESGAEGEILLDLGNAGGVEIEFNGESVGPFGPPGSVRKGIRFAPGSPGVVPKQVRPAAPPVLEDRSL